MPLATLDNTGGFSCGTDNKTKFWDFYTLKVVAEIPEDSNNNYSSGSRVRSRIIRG